MNDCGRTNDEPTHSTQIRSNQYEVFASAVDDHEVWVSGLGLGAGSADVNVNSPDWSGGPDLARQLFYSYLATGRYAVDRARLVPRWAARSDR